MYDRGHSGWRSAYQVVGTQNPDGSVQVSPQQLASYRHPDWYEERFKQGEYLMGLITKVDQAKNEATVRFGNYTAIVDGQRYGPRRTAPTAQRVQGRIPLRVQDQRK